MESANDCLNDDTLLDFVQARLPRHAVNRADVHINACAYCRRMVADLAKYFYDEVEMR